MSKRTPLEQKQETALQLFNLKDTLMESPDERQMMGTALMHSENDAIRRFATELLMKDNSGISFATMAYNHGFSGLQLWREYKNLRKEYSLVRMGHRIPNLVDQVMDDAESKVTECPCEGKNKSCPDCKGSGRFYKLGDAQSRKIVFESMDMIGKNRGITINNNNLAAIESNEKMEDLIDSISPILEGN